MIIGIASSAERGDQARHADEADIAYGLDDRDVVLSPVFLHLNLDRAFPFFLRVSKPLVKPGVIWTGILHGPGIRRTVYLHVENYALAEFRTAGAHRPQQIDHTLARLAEYFGCQPGVVVCTSIVFLRLSNQPHVFLLSF